MGEGRRKKQHKRREGGFSAVFLVRNGGALVVGAEGLIKGRERQKDRCKERVTGPGMLTAR